MNRLFSRICVALLAGGLVACSATNHTSTSLLNTPLEGFVPATAGTTYTYQDKGGTYRRDVIAADGPTTTERTSSGKTFTWVADLLTLADSNGVPYTHEVNFEKLWPLQIGKSAPWRSFQHGVLAGEGTFYVIGKERIRVPAGEFTAFMVKLVWTNFQSRWTGEITRWMVPEIGRWVKYVSVTNTDKGTRNEEVVLLSIRPTSEVAAASPQSNIVTTSASVPPTGGCLTRLWGNEQITPPAATVPDPLRRWSGLYGNDRWDGALCNSLAVLEVNADGTARVQYAHGTWSAWKINRAGFYSYPAKIEGSKLSFEVPALGVRAVYTLDGNTLKGEWHGNGTVNKTTLSRVTP